MPARVLKPTAICKYLGPRPLLLFNNILPVMRTGYMLGYSDTTIIYTPVDILPDDWGRLRSTAFHCPFNGDMNGDCFIVGDDDDT